MINYILFRVFYQELRVNTGKLTKTLWRSSETQSRTFYLLWTHLAII